MPSIILENTQGADALAGIIHQEVAKYMKGKASVEGNYINFSNLQDFAGTIINFALHILDYVSSVTWIIDRSASNSFCTNLKLFSNPIID